MSLNVQVVANKCQFSNEFPNGFILPINAQVALTKCALTIPVFIQNVLIVPPMLGPARGQDAFRICIDGIVNYLTWDDIYNAHVAYGQVGNIEPDITADDYFSGYYEYFTNNQMYFNTNPTSVANDGNKPPFTWVLAKAIDTKYQFYSCNDISTYEGQDIGLDQYNAGAQKFH